MEMYISNQFVDLNSDLLSDVNGGTFWGVVNGGFEIIGGVAGVIGGAALLLVPEPTGVTKFAGGAAIIGGVVAVGSGIATIKQNI